MADLAWRVAFKLASSFLARSFKESSMTERRFVGLVSSLREDWVRPVGRSSEEDRALADLSSMEDLVDSID